MRRTHDLWKSVIALACFTLFFGGSIASIHAAEPCCGPTSLNSPAAASVDDIKAVPSCPFCGMDRQKFAHSRVFIQYDDGSVMGACSVHCAAADLAVNLDKTPLAILVGEYNRKNLIDAEKAVWVMGGKKMGVMTKRAKWAFEKPQDAEQFILVEGGEVVPFEKAIRAAYEDMYEDTKMIRERRKAKRMTQKAHGHH